MISPDTWWCLISYAAQEDDIPDKMVMQVLPIQGTFIVVSTTAKLKMIIMVSILMIIGKTIDIDYSSSTFVFWKDFTPAFISKIERGGR